MICTAVFLTTAVGMEIFRRWSLRRELFDLPNERSSHTAPTPRGGGLVLVAVCLTAYVVTTVFLTGNFQRSYLVGAALIALISWLDDVYTISFVWRFLVHSLAALLVVFGLGYFREIYFPFVGVINTGAAGAAITFLWIVWLTNAYNFMDGIDGIAGMQSLTAGIGWLLVGGFLNLQGVSLYGGIVAFAGLGFLTLNWQPAKIFMGDVGSAFLGYSFAVFPLLAKGESGQATAVQPILLPVGVLLVWLFVFDSLWTFAGRALRGEKVWQAHRGHIYQKLVISGFSHQFVTILYGSLSTLTVLSVRLFLDRRSDLSVALIFIIALQSAGLLTCSMYFKRRGLAV